VLAAKELSQATASQLYRWRWKNEGLFRTYKHTISGVKFRARTVAHVHREAEGSLLAVQILLAHAVWQLRDHGEAEEIRVSARRVLVLIRQDIVLHIGMYLGPRQRQSYAMRLEQAVQRQRRRRSLKACRIWPRRKPHKPPMPPKIQRMTEELKARADKIFRTSSKQN